MNIFGKTLTPSQRLDKAVIDIMAHERYCALNGVMMIGSRSIREDIETACTNGRDTFYSPVFIDSLTDPELRFLVLHEEYHKMYRHLHIWRWMYDENADLANKANDYVINVKLVDENAQDNFAVMPEKGCYDDKYRGWDSARVFHDLRKQAKKGSGQGQGQGQGGLGKPQKGNGEGFDEHDWDGAKQMTAEETRELAREMDSAIRQGLIMAEKRRGKNGSGGGELDLSDLLSPQIPWQDQLREFVTETCAGQDYSTYAKPNRKYVSLGIYMPSGVSEKVRELVIAVDTSGSVFTGHEQRAFFSEVQGIVDSVKPEKIILLYWDTRIVKREDYEGADVDNLCESTKPVGGGGTVVTCVTDYFRDEGLRPQAAIVMTDGYVGSDWGQGRWPCPVLFGIVDNKETTAPCGTTVHISTEELR